MADRFKHIERRFVIPEDVVSVMTRELNSVLPKGKTYGTETTYVDTPERTWSLLGDTLLPKMRVRTYNGKESFFEKKIHIDDETVKERIPLPANEPLIPAGLVAVGYTSYRRSEHSVDGVRVTVDRNLSTKQTEGGDGRAHGFIVVEVKGELPKALRFIRPFEDKKFGKWKLLSGRWVAVVEDEL